MIEATREHPVDIDSLRALATSSIELIERLQDASGAYPASPTFSAYRGYSWFRDGAFIADAMSSAGRVASATAFFDWCSSIVLARRERIEDIVGRAAAGNPAPDREMLPTRFTLDGADGDDEWWDFQLDGYGTWLWAVVEHARRHRIDLDRWAPALVLTVDYLLSSWSRPCFDWWEESADRVHVSTLGCISAGLRSVAGSDVIDPTRLAQSTAVVDEIVATIRERGSSDGHLTKWLGSTDVDASLLAMISPLDVVPVSDPLGLNTVATIERDLAQDGGVHRYRRDTFFGGGQWPLLTCFLGLADAARGSHDLAMDRLRWAASTADADEQLPEQVGWHLLDPTRVDEWTAKWGPVARPLLWSHAMYVRLAVELGVTKVGRAA
ncbi:MAG: isomaltose glucohydrolase [Actinomycetota bacterium]|jgi:GH15 family glucan-1,4-alpha-glucosidase|nr:isomaltose glucohydrolase [Actinomycetota bacterium]